LQHFLGDLALFQQDLAEQRGAVRDLAFSDVHGFSPQSCFLREHSPPATQNPAGLLLRVSTRGNQIFSHNVKGTGLRLRAWDASPRPAGPASFGCRKWKKKQNVSAVPGRRAGNSAAILEQRFANTRTRSSV